MTNPFFSTSSYIFVSFLEKRSGSQILRSCVSLRSGLTPCAQYRKQLSRLPSRVYLHIFSSTLSRRILNSRRRRLIRQVFVSFQIDTKTKSYLYVQNIIISVYDFNHSLRNFLKHECKSELLWRLFPVYILSKFNFPKLMSVS